MMQNGHITLYLTHQRAHEAALKVLANIRAIVGYNITQGTVRWEDGSVDKGFKVQVYDDGGLYRYL